MTFLVAYPGYCRRTNDRYISKTVVPGYTLWFLSAIKMDILHGGYVAVGLVYFKAISLWRMRSQDHKTKNESLPLDRPRDRHSENINA